MMSGSAADPPQRLLLDLILEDRVHEVVSLDQHSVEADVCCWDGNDQAGARWRVTQNAVGWTVFSERVLYPACLRILIDQPIWLRGEAPLRSSPERRVVLSVYGPAGP